ncbi:Probable protein phosphatase 2C 62 [Linum perenne]
MEDFGVAEKRKLDGHDLHLYAIFDGHSGRHVAQYLQTHLLDNILTQPDLLKKPKSRGGCVIRRPGNVDRVDGQLAMSRAFGDGKVKEHISSEPDLKIVSVELGDECDFLIVASDGLWKVMSNQDACECIRDFVDPTDASKELVSEAVGRGSKDDISCIVVMFR